VRGQGGGYRPILRCERKPVGVQMYLYLTRAQQA